MGDSHGDMRTMGIKKIPRHSAVVPSLSVIASPGENGNRVSINPW